MYYLSRSYYEELIKSNVQIYEYEPGFVHGKMFISDDDKAVVGTTNLDYRSLYLHFECGVWMFNCGTIYEIKDDFVRTLEVCDEVTLEEIEKTSSVKKFGQSILRLVAPLL